MNLTLEEQEFHINVCADDPTMVMVYTDWPKYQRKMESIGATLVKESGPGKHYTLHIDQLLLRKGKPKRAPMSEENKAAFAKRMGR